MDTGIITAVVDSACGYAALSLTPPGVGVLTVAFKVNLLNEAGQTLLGARAGGEAWADDYGLHRRGDGDARPHRSLG